MEVPCVQHPPGEHAEREVAEHLHGADPGDGRVFEGERVGVVLLEDAEGGDHAPCVEDYQVAHDGLRPGFAAAVWGWAGVDDGGVGAGGDCFGEFDDGVFRAGGGGVGGVGWEVGFFFFWFLSFFSGGLLGDGMVEGHVFYLGTFGRVILTVVGR